MIECKDFYDFLVDRNVEYFAGVPDSLLKDFSGYVMDHSRNGQHVITANEGVAVARAAGYYLSTGKLGLVYMQNSGEGNAINPLLSLVDSEVYSIPMLLLIGWRGNPSDEKKDEPQHIKQGKVTIDLLNSVGIPNTVLPDDIDGAKQTLEKAIYTAKEKGSAYGIVVRQGTFAEYKFKKNKKTIYDLKREDALKLVIDQIDEKDIVVSTTGKTSRELFEYREELGQGHEKDFLCVGNMGHASSIAIEIAIKKTNRQVICLDGDGAFIMHMGAITDIGNSQAKNFKHIVFNNGCHDSVGGQPTAGFEIDIPEVAKSCGYKSARRAMTSGEIIEGMKLLKKAEGPSLLEIRVNKGARVDLGRPTTTPIENKIAFMKYLKD